jgi:hypothetical protein
MIVMIPLALIRKEVADPIATIIDVALHLFLIHPCHIMALALVPVLQIITPTLILLVIMITGTLPMAKISPLNRTPTQLRIYLTALIPTVVSFKSVILLLRSSRIW